jgi:hypothetical protein
MSDNEEQRPIEENEDEVIELKVLNKTNSKPKRIMSEKQKETLAKARELAYQKRREMADMSKKEKELKREQHLIKKLELQKKINQHEEYKKKLLIDSGLAPKPVRSYKKKEEVIEEEDQEEQDEIKQLEEKLAKLKTKKKVIKEPESEPEEESEEEIEEEFALHSRQQIEEPPKLTHKPIKKPEMKEPKNRTTPRKPDMRQSKEQIDKVKPPLITTNDPEIVKNLKQLFPNFEF